MRVEGRNGRGGRLLVLVLVGVVLGLTACTGDDDPSIGSDGSDADPASVEVGTDGEVPGRGEAEPTGTTLVVTGAPDQSTTPGQADGSGSVDGDQPTTGAGADGSGGDAGTGQGGSAGAGDGGAEPDANSPDVSVQP